MSTKGLFTRTVKVIVFVSGTFDLFDVLYCLWILIREHCLHFLNIPLGNTQRENILAM